MLSIILFPLYCSVPPRLTSRLTVGSSRLSTAALFCGIFQELNKLRVVRATQIRPPHFRQLLRRSPLVVLERRVDASFKEEHCTLITSNQRAPVQRGVSVAIRQVRPLPLLHLEHELHHLSMAVRASQVQAIFAPVGEASHGGLILDQILEAPNGAGLAGEMHG